MRAAGPQKTTVALALSCCVVRALLGHPFAAIESGNLRSRARQSPHATYAGNAWVRPVQTTAGQRACEAAVPRSGRCFQPAAAAQALIRGQELPGEVPFEKSQSVRVERWRDYQTARGLSKKIKILGLKTFEAQDVVPPTPRPVGRRREIGPGVRRAVQRVPAGSYPAFRVPAPPPPKVLVTGSGTPGNGR